MIERSANLHTGLVKRQVFRQKEYGARYLELPKVVKKLIKDVFPTSNDSKRHVIAQSVKSHKIMRYFNV